MNQNDLREIQALLTSGKNFLILTHENPELDALAASIALSYCLEQAGKITTIACPTPLTVEYSNLFGIDRVETKIGNKNLVISLDYAEGSIEKVSYNVEGDKFNLVIQPKDGFPPFSPQKVHYSYSGISADAIFVIGAQEFSELGNLYETNKETFTKIPTINIDYHEENSQFGKINLVSPTSSSCSQIILQIVRMLNLPVDADAASNLLTGIEEATRRFQSRSTTAQDFEAAAFCLNKGAKRLFREEGEKPGKGAKVLPEVSEEKQKQVKSNEKKPPPDWLQPKIYKGGQLL